MVSVRAALVVQAMVSASDSHDDTVLLQTRELVMAQKVIVPREVMAIAHSHDFQNTSIMLGQYAMDVVHGRAAIDDDSKQALSDMKDSLTADTQKYVMDNHQTDQNLLNVAANRVKECNDNLVPKRTSDETSIAKMVADSTSHTECRQELATLIANREKACSELDEFINGIASCPSPPTGRTGLGAFFASVGNIYHSREEWENLDAECTSSETAETEKDAQCDSLQDTYESGACQTRLTVYTSCAEHFTCFNEAESEYDEIQMAVETNEAGRKVDWVAIEKIKCYIDVLVSDAAPEERASELEVCNGQEADTSALNIQYPQIVDKLECSVSAVDTEYPCSSDFTTEYSGMDGLLECTPCEPLPNYLADFENVPLPENGAGVGTKTMTDDSGTWTKIYQIDGTNEFAYNTGAVGSLDEDEVTQNAKLSDDAINALAKPLDGYSHVYRLKSDKGDSRAAFVRTNNPYKDDENTFGAGVNEGNQGMADTYGAVARWSSFHHGPDFLHFGGEGGESCNRYFFGHGRRDGDCWSGTPGMRCIRGGSSCRGTDRGNYAKLTDVTVWIFSGQ